MTHLGSDGKRFSPEELERLTQALISLELSCLDTAPEALSSGVLLAWHTALSAGLDRMQPGQYRHADITYGFETGTAPALISAAVEDVMVTHQQVLAEWSEAPTTSEVLFHATWIHAELIRIHPFWDGNGRLARLVQAWLCWSYGLQVPIYTNRTAYLAGLNRYHSTRDLSLLMTVTWASLPAAT
jgi:Fic family protein